MVSEGSPDQFLLPMCGDFGNEDPGGWKLLASRGRCAPSGGFWVAVVSWERVLTPICPSHQLPLIFQQWVSPGVPRNARNGPAFAVSGLAFPGDHGVGQAGDVEAGA